MEGAALVALVEAGADDQLMLATDAESVRYGRHDYLLVTRQVRSGHDRSLLICLAICKEGHVIKHAISGQITLKCRAKGKKTYVRLPDGEEKYWPIVSSYVLYVEKLFKSHIAYLFLFVCFLLSP